MMPDTARRHAAAVAKYVVIGGASALVEWSVFWVLLNAASLHYLLAAIVAFVIATLANYLLCINTMFASKTNSRWKDAAMVYVASVLALIVNVATLAILIQQFRIDPMLAKIAGTGTAFLFNFASRRFVIFRERSDGQEYSLWSRAGR